MTESLIFYPKRSQHRKLPERIEVKKDRITNVWHAMALLEDWQQILIFREQDAGRNGKTFCRYELVEEPMPISKIPYLIITTPAGPNFNWQAYTIKWTPVELMTAREVKALANRYLELQAFI